MTATTISPDTTATVPLRQAVRTIPTTRLIRVELRKMFNTRSGSWMLISIGLLSVLATCAVIIFAPDDAVTYESFATAIGFPMSVILPIIAILGVTSEWSQRSGLTTFTLVPSRGRVIGAKAIATFLVGMAIGFTLGVVLRNSAAAIVGYFVVSLVLPGILALLAQVRSWFADLQPWIDWNYTQVALFENDTDTAREWAMLASTTGIWIALPLVIGLLFLRRSEVK